MEPLLRISDLRMRFKLFEGVSHVLKEVNLEVGRGERVALAGESGCGKSVTLRPIMGLVQQDNARVADRVVGMFWGKAVQLGPTPELSHAPEHSYTRMLISSIPVISEEVEALKPQWPGEHNLTPDSGAVLQGCPFAPRCLLAKQACWAQVPLLTAVRDDHYSACHRVSGMIPNKLVKS